jgi:ArsR family transcriptional regulator
VETKQVIEAFGALAHEHRLAVYRMLVEAGPAGLAAGVIAERLGVPPSSLTFHTQALVRAGLATQRRASRQLIYAADFAAMNGLVGFLTENCCGRDAEAAVACGPVCNPAVAATPGKTRMRSA